MYTKLEEKRSGNISKKGLGAHLVLLHSSTIYAIHNRSRVRRDYHVDISHLDRLLAGLEQSRFFSCFVFGVWQDLMIVIV